ncbi:hypothetical protein NEAUS04_2672, partial [Nematocida ausubeli]
YIADGPIGRAGLSEEVHRAAQGLHATGQLIIKMMLWQLPEPAGCCLENEKRICRWRMRRAGRAQARHAKKGPCFTWALLHCSLPVELRCAQLLGCRRVAGPFAMFAKLRIACGEARSIPGEQNWKGFILFCLNSA